MKNSEWITYLEEIANQGKSHAQYELGRCYYYGENDLPIDKKKAVMWFKKAAYKGHVDGKLYLGICYYYGEGLNENKVKAKNIFTELAESGHQHAQLYVDYFKDPDIRKKEELYFEYCRRVEMRRNAEEEREFWEDLSDEERLGWEDRIEFSNKN